MKKKTKKTLFWFVLAVILTIVDIIIPDPLPLVDEIALGLWASILGIKLIARKR